MKPYYYVYRYQSAAPVFRHATLEAAQAEAERLATKHPGMEFEILQAVAVSRIHGPASTFFMDGEWPKLEKRIAGLRVGSKSKKEAK
jgi:hypothetical protein